MHRIAAMIFQHLGHAGLALAMGALVAPAGCRDATQDVAERASRPSGPTIESPQPADTVDPHWVHQASPRNRTAVVFVHGLFGSTTGTWNLDDGRGFFRYLHQQPGVGERVDIFAFGFSSHMLRSGSLDIREAANKLEQSLQYHGVWDYPNVVFVAHSMGGLVALRELVARPERRERVPLLMLYATPARGADIAAVGRRFSPNPALAQMTPADGNALLQQLSDDWGLVPDAAKPAVICAYEKKPTLGQMIVPWSSAVAFCKGTPLAIEDADHISIVKPDRPEHPSVVALVNALREFVLGRAEAGFLETPDFREEDGAWVMQMVDPNGSTTVRLINKGPLSLSYTIAELSDPRLAIYPSPTPRTVPAGAPELLTVFLSRGGELKEEYRFSLSTPVMGSRVVKVRLPDRGAIERRQAELDTTVIAGMTDFLAQPENQAKLQALSPAQRSESLAKVAREVLDRELPGLPEGPAWYLTADIMASAGLNRAADAALARSGSDPARTINPEATRRLDRQLRRTIPVPGAVVPPERITPAAELTASPSMGAQVRQDSLTRLRAQINSSPALRDSLLQPVPMPAPQPIQPGQLSNARGATAPVLTPLQRPAPGGEPSADAQR